MNYSQKIQDMLLYNPDALVEAMCKDKEVFSLFYDFSLQTVILRRTTGKEQPDIFELDELADLCKKVERGGQGRMDATTVAEMCGDLWKQGRSVEQIQVHCKELIQTWREV